MGSHLTDALVELGATVHAFVRATSSGALNNIGHLRDRLKVHFADLTDRTSVDYLVRELKESASDRPYVFHLGAQAHVGESWHRPYETVAANVLGTLNLLQAVVDCWPRAREVRHRRHVGGVRERARSSLRASRLRRGRRPHPPRALAHQPEVDLRDGEGRGGLPDDELLRRLRRAGGRHADVQQLRAAPEPAIRDGDDHHAGAHARDDRARRARSAARLLLLHGRRARPPDRRRQGDTGRRLRLRPGREHLDARLGRPHPPRRGGRGLLARRPRGRLDARRGTARARARCSHCASGTRSSRPRPAGSRACPGRKACSRRSAGTPRTASAGSAASTGSRPARRSGRS